MGCLGWLWGCHKFLHPTLARYVHLVNNSIIKHMDGFKNKNEAWSSDSF